MRLLEPDLNTEVQESGGGRLCVLARSGRPERLSDSFWCNAIAGEELATPVMGMGHEHLPSTEEMEAVGI